MSNYRRLISYIYAYEGGIKGKNIGFAKIEARNGQCKISVNVKKVYVGSSDMGVYLLTGETEIMLGKIFIRNGSGEFRTSVLVTNVENSGRTMDQCYGLTIHSVEDSWQAYTTIWEDAAAQAAVEANAEPEELIAHAAEISQTENDVVEKAAEIELSKVTSEQIEQEEINKKPDTMIPEIKDSASLLHKSSIVEEIEADIQAQSQLDAKQNIVFDWNLETRGKAERQQQPSQPQPSQQQPSQPQPSQQQSSQPQSQLLQSDQPPAMNPYQMFRNWSKQQNQMAQQAQFAQRQQQPEPSAQPPEPSVQQPEPSAQQPEPSAQQSEPSVQPPPEPPRLQPPLQPVQPPVGNQEMLDRMEQEEEEENQSGLLWEHFRKAYPKIQAFDYVHGCEILTIKPQDIGLLPRETWTYGNNSFLLHGYYNYRYLILVKLMNPEGEPRYLLGVPGHYYSNEKYMATMFGFPNFVLSKMQPTEDGRFGYWYADINMGNQ